ncbi:unnamed protein product, partial [Lampetra planeri]
PNSTAGHDYERLKLQCMKAMADLQSLQNQHSSTLKRCEEAVKKADFYHTLHCRMASEHAQMKEELQAVRQDNVQLVREHNHVKQACEELRRLHDEDQREVTDMRMLHQQVMREGSSDALNKLYDTAIDKLEATKNEYESLRKLYNEKTAGHNADLSRLDRAEEENHRLQKQLDMLLKQRDAAIHYQQQYSSSIRRFDNTQQELSKAAAQNKELQREMERLQSEATRFKTQQLKAAKDCEKYKEERDSVISEYRLIMSERDQVIKEVERLQTGLEMAEAKLQDTSSERRVASEELEALRQELASALKDRDRAICEKNELLERYCHEVKDKAEAQKELNQACKDIEMVREERDVARKERTEAIIQRDQLLRERVLPGQTGARLCHSGHGTSQQGDRDAEEAVRGHLPRAEGVLQEAEVAKCRRDWAFQERDKIVAERESIRTLCDNLRRERDRAVSDLADALRNLDDTRKQKNDAARELKELKEKMEDQLEKEARFRQLMAHTSHDSAIDMDLMEWETEVIEFEMHRSCSGQSLSESLRDSEKMSRLQSCESHLRSCRTSKHICSKQTDVCSCDLSGKSDDKETGDSLDGSSSIHCHKSCTNSSQHSRSLSCQGTSSASHSPSDPHPEFCYRRQDFHRHPFTFTPVPSDCSSPQTVADRTIGAASKPSGGTWPKVIVGASIPECAQLSIYKRAKQRKSIFDVNAFRRPEGPPKLDYMSLSPAAQALATELHM